MNEAKKTVAEKEKGYDVVLFDLFRSIKLTIFLLILLAALSVIGTVITQNASSEAYIERYGARPMKSSISLISSACITRGGSRQSLFFW